VSEGGSGKEEKGNEAFHSAEMRELEYKRVKWIECKELSRPFG
jgi:hypothetical protein